MTYLQAGDEEEENVGIFSKLLKEKSWNKSEEVVLPSATI